LRGHDALVLQGLDVSVLDMGFLPIPMKVLGDLFFFSLGPILLFFFFSLAIRFSVCGILCVCPLHLLLGFRCDIFWI
jgi:hypothetical protein